MLHHRPACINSANDNYSRMATLSYEWAITQTLALLDSYSTLLCDLLLKKYTDIELFLYNEIKVNNTT